jgi:hypothetical protein
MAKQNHHPFAFCPVHGVFSAPWVAALAPGTSIRFEDCVTNCLIPKCDKKCEIISGLYEAKADRLNVLLHPSISVEALTAIRELALKLQSRKITPAQASRAAKKYIQRQLGFSTFGIGRLRLEQHCSPVLSTPPEL